MVVGSVLERDCSGEKVTDKRSKVTIGRLSERVAVHREERSRSLSHIRGYVIWEEC